MLWPAVPSARMLLHVYLAIRDTTSILPIFAPSAPRWRDASCAPACRHAPTATLDITSIWEAASRARPSAIARSAPTPQRAQLASQAMR